MGTFCFFTPPKKETKSTFFVNLKNNIFFTRDMFLLGYFDVCEHIFNIGLMMEALLAPPPGCPEKFFHT